MLTGEKRTKIARDILNEGFTAADVAKSLDLDITTSRKWEKTSGTQGPRLSKPGIT